MSALVDVNVLLARAVLLRAVVGATPKHVQVLTDP